jgi:hypothetical protein
MGVATRKGKFRRFIVSRLANTYIGTMFTETSIIESICVFFQDLES